MSIYCNPSRCGRREFIQRLSTGAFAIGTVLFELACGAEPEKEEARKPRRRVLPVREPKKEVEPTIFLEKAKALFPGRVHEVLSNLKAFALFGEKLATSEHGATFLAGKRDLTILYPGSGVHLSPLELVVQMAEAMHEPTPCVKLIYTEISEDSYSKIEGDLRKILESIPGFSGFSMKESDDLNPGTEKSMVFKYTTLSGKEVEVDLIFAFRRSGGTAFFRDEYFAEADILLAHDTTTTQEGYEAQNQALRLFGEGFASPTWREKEKVIIIEYGHGDQYRMAMHVAVGGFDRVIAPYGCGENHKDHQIMFEQAAIIYANIELFHDLARVDPELVKIYFDLISFKHSEDRESVVLETHAGHPWREKYDKVKPLINNDLLQLMNALPLLSEANQKFLSGILFSLIAGSFNFGLLGDPQFLQSLHRVVKNKFGARQQPGNIMRAVSAFQEGSRLPELYRPVLLGNHASERLLAYLVASKTNDTELLEQLREVVDAEIGNINGDLAIMYMNARQFRSIEADIAYERDGLFLFRYVPYIERSRQGDGYRSTFEGSAEKLLTILSVGSRLDGPNMEETRRFFREKADLHRGDVPAGKETYWDVFYRAASM